MIANATIQSAKIAAIDAAKITTGTLSADRIAANSITAGKLATDAIQIGLAGWTSTIRITPTQISWYDSSTLVGFIDKSGMNFYRGAKFIGKIGESSYPPNQNIRGISMDLNETGGFISWNYRVVNNVWADILTLDPVGSIYPGKDGIHLGNHLFTHSLGIAGASGLKLYVKNYAPAGISSPTLSGYDPHDVNNMFNTGVVFGKVHLYVDTNGYIYNLTNVFTRVSDLMLRVNEMIRRLNYGWVSSAIGATSTWDETGLTEMDTTL